MDAVELYIAWLILCIPVAIWARARGLNPWGYLFVSIILSPVVGGLAVGLAGPGKKRCPRCAERIEAAAVICPHCRSELK